jgi:NADPH:quinone reductase-like Zn-dependent oxidoreductase
VENLLRGRTFFRFASSSGWHSSLANIKTVEHGFALRASFTFTRAIDNTMTRSFPVSFKAAFVSSLYACLLLQLPACATAHLSQKDQSNLAGKTYVVTGASRGIGRGVAHKLGSHGANVVLAARRSEVLEEVASEVRAAGGEPLVATTDVSDPDDIQNLADSAVEQFGRIDVWINNAGSGPSALSKTFRWRTIRA